jgi:hypothetical protein
MTIPASKFGLVAEEYCKLFSKDGARPDQLGDRGLEYRNVVGIPGGVKSPLAKELVEASVRQGDKLDFAAGKGDDADRRGLVWIYDTKEFPFYLGEVYHRAPRRLPLEPTQMRPPTCSHIKAWAGALSWRAPPGQSSMTASPLARTTRSRTTAWPPRRSRLASCATRAAPTG